MENTVLSFREFLGKYFPTYIIDSNNESVVEKFTQWAARDPKFEDKELGHHLDKGILLTGTIGTGKTDLFVMLKYYLNQYLRSKYAFKDSVVWSFTSAFNQKGYESLNNQEHGNMYYDELCLTDDNTNFPEKERAMNYGSKIIVGAEIILLRYNSFKQFGYQTHFTTNADFKDLKRIYGERAYSRLNEMCNFLVLTGEDRRESSDPRIFKNMNAPVQDKVVPSKELTEKEIEENKQMLEKEYATFLQTGEVSILVSMHYIILKQIGVNLGSDEETEEYKKIAKTKFTEPISMARKFESERKQELTTFVNNEYKKIAVTKFYEKMKAGGAKSIFGDADFNNNEIMKKLIKK